MLLSLARLRAAHARGPAAEQAGAAKAIFERLGQAKNAREADELISRLAAAPA